MSEKDNEDILQAQDNYKYGFHDNVSSIFDTGKGINEEVVRQISKAKKRT